jgi:hypothetical protein
VLPEASNEPLAGKKGYIGNRQARAERLHLHGAGDAGLHAERHVLKRALGPSIAHSVSPEHHAGNYEQSEH